MSLSRIACLLFVFSGGLLACGDDTSTPDDGADADADDGRLDESTEDAETVEGDDVEGSDGEAGDEGDGGVCGNNVVELPEECDDGNLIPGDGCEPDCTTTRGPVTVTCEELPPLASGTCEVAAGDTTLLIRGVVLVPGTVYVGGQVVVNAAGSITCVGCDCAATAPTATRLTCPLGVISPGLINTHDHITYTQNLPAADSGERYEQRSDWRTGARGHTEIDAPGGATSEEIAWGELRFLLGGATSTAGSGSAAGYLRNFDTTTRQEGLSQPQFQGDTFPLGDTAGEQLVGSCAYPDIRTAASIAGYDAYEAHVSEGIDAVARNEFLCLSSSTGGGQDLVQPQTAFTHAIGLLAADYAQMGVDGTSLIWSPRSNISLYGNTAVVSAAARLGVEIALGTDWIPSGSMNLLRELRCADLWNGSYLGGFFTDEQLWLMVTRNAARVMAVDDVVGTLAVGLVADISIFDGSLRPQHRAVIDAQPQDVTLVMRGGRVLYGDEAVVTGLGRSGCDVVDVCGSSKHLCATIDASQTYTGLQAAVGAGMYAAFFCTDRPTNEPTCVPSRPAAVSGSTIYTGVPAAGDADGDGIPDVSDNCPAVFNPIRPVDGGVQADGDGDTAGDPCDDCPIGDSTGCVFDPDDRDSDGIPNDSDNCPAIPNPLQDDADMDGKGDACDECPTVSNPGALACPATIYEIKNGTVDVGGVVAVRGALVTGRNTRGFYLQAKVGDPGYAGPDYSGVYVYGTNTVAVGDRVDLTSATVADFFDQIQLESATVVVLSSLGEAPPDPVDETPANVATGGSRAAALESVIVRVSGVRVTDINPAAGGGDTPPINEFVVTGSLRVNDFLYLVTPFPTVGDDFPSITGILDYRNDDSKLEPRSAADFVFGSARLVGFGPEPAFVSVGTMAVPTIPTPLTVTLTHAVATDTFVSITSDTPTALTVVVDGVTVLAGATSAPVLVNGLVQAASVLLTATLGTDVLTSHVRVVGASEVPTLASLTPSAVTVRPGGTATFTASLDIPAWAGGVVIGLSLTPPTAGTVPATVTVPAEQLSATFDVVDAAMVTNYTLTATLGASTLSATVTVGTMADHLIINELDYDQLATDATEFAEIFNPTPLPVDLAGYTLVLVNGSVSTTYRSVDLGPAGTLPAGGYLVWGATSVVSTLPVSVLRVDAGAVTNLIQNGRSSPTEPPDGIALVHAGALVDALSYEGPITAATVTGITGPVSLVEGTALPATVADSNSVPGSLSRLPDGTDTDNAATDWAFTSTPTPGAPNVP